MVNDDTWSIIDYEWTFGKSVAVKELAFRAIYCYLLEDRKRGCLEMDRILELLQITQEDAQQLREQEREFQSFVTGKRMAMAQMRELIGYRVMQPAKWIDQYQDSEHVNRVQIYEDLGDGYREETSYFVKDAYRGENHIELEIPVSGNVKMLRIDPCMDACMVKVKELTFNGVEIPLQNKKNLLINGRLLKASRKEDANHPSMVFPTTDPNINLVLEGLERKGENVLTANMEIVRIPMEMAQDMAGAVKRII